MRSMSEQLSGSSPEGPGTLAPVSASFLEGVVQLPGLSMLESQREKVRGIQNHGRVAGCLRRGTGGHVVRSRGPQFKLQSWLCYQLTV